MISTSHLLEFVKKEMAQWEFSEAHTFLDYTAEYIEDTSNVHEKRMHLLIGAAYALAFQAIEEEKLANAENGCCRDE